MFGMIVAALLADQAVCPPVPSPRQLAWHAMETYAFVHFGPNTFTGKEWGEGKEDPNVFAPTALDCRQWVRVFKEAGLKGVIITAKHHDGFCLWPSKYSTHTVAQSRWRGGKGDVLKDLSEACREAGLKLGVYLSPWDRNHPAYGTPEYNKVFARMLEEVLTRYGPIFEVWFDGANGEGPNGKKQVYDWPLFVSTVRKHQPDAVIFSDAGPDIRWVGNEAGHSAPTCWAMVDGSRYTVGTPLYAELTEGSRNGDVWRPAECDVSIRPGWFWRESENDKVKSPEQLEDLYYRSVGQNAAFLLNVPPDTRGLIHEEDARVLREWRKRLDATFAADLAQGRLWHPDGNGFAVDLPSPTRFDRVVLREPIAKGQRIAKFQILADGKPLASGTTIGYKRILRVPATTARRIEVVVEDSRAEPLLEPVGLYASPNAMNPNPTLDVDQETPAEKNKRMAWFREARFGMFIHWGLYAIPAGVWNGKNIPGAAEWILYSAQIRVEDYEPLLGRFEPVKFDAKEWVRIAKDAGMKYIVITSKHHDGFGLWDSKLTEWDVMGTPFKRDILKELAAACKEAGVRLCFYHSIMDWHHPDYLPRRPWDPRPEIQPDFERYVQYMKGQLKELLTGYGDIGILWFDGEWEATWTHERGKDLYRYVRSLQPSIIVNNRVDKGRGGMGGMSDAGFYGDYGTPEQEIPPGGLPGADWESCMTMNETWGFHQNDHAWKSARTLVENLVDCASKGGNYLLNVGPTALGEIPPPSVERLAEVGKWMRKYGSTIYGTQAGPFLRPLSWGRATQTPGRLNLFLFEEGKTRLDLPGLKGRLIRAHPFGDPARTLAISQTEDGYAIDLAGWQPEGMVPVVVVEVEGALTAEPVPIRPGKDGVVTLEAVDATTHGSARYESDKRCIGYWTDASSWVGWEFRGAAPGRYRVAAEIACDPDSGGAEVVFEIGDKTLTHTVSPTKGWTDFVTVDLGEVDLAGDRVAVAVRAKSKPRLAVMNLRRLFLRPVSKE
jgi:alpha-L-fucosidase